MSHFSTLVIIPGDTPVSNVYERVSELLEPFNEEIEMEPYEEECYCVNSAARSAGVEAANAVKDMDQYRQEFWAMINARAKESGEEVDPSDKEWDDFTAEWRRIRDEATKAHPMYQKPDPECEECNGTGIHMSTYNPNSKWDWWSIGGRWSGTIGSPELGYKDLCRVKEIPTDYVPFAILTPDGEWAEKGSMGWWAIVHDEKDEDAWDEEARRIFAKYPEHIAVLCDLHI